METFRAEGATVGDVLAWFAANNPHRLEIEEGSEGSRDGFGLFVAKLGECPCRELRPHHLFSFINEGTDADQAWTSASGGTRCCNGRSIWPRSSG